MMLEMLITKMVAMMLEVFVAMMVAMMVVSVMLKIGIIRMLTPCGQAFEKKKWHGEGEIIGREEMDGAKMLTNQTPNEHETESGPSL